MQIYRFMYLLLLALTPRDQPAITRFATLDLGKVGEGMRTQHTHLCSTSAAARLKLSGNELLCCLALVAHKGRRTANRAGGRLSQGPQGRPNIAR
jgi:hypothetical protein